MGAAPHSTSLFFELSTIIWFQSSYAQPLSTKVVGWAIIDAKIKIGSKIQPAISFNSNGSWSTPRCGQGSWCFPSVKFHQSTKIFLISCYISYACCLRLCLFIVFSPCVACFLQPIHDQDVLVTSQKIFCATLVSGLSITSLWPRPSL